MSGVPKRLARRLTAASAVWLVMALAGSAFALWAFAELADGVVEGEFRAFDRGVLLWIGNNSPDWLDGPMRLVTALGYYWVWLPLLVVAAGGFYLKGYKLSAALLVVASSGGMVLTMVLKSVFQRARPELLDSGYTASFYSFPSGHATVAVGFYGMLTLLLALRFRGLSRWSIAAAGTLLVLLIGFSRLYLGVHYPTDVLAGYLATPLWLIAVAGVYALWRVVGRRRKARRGARPEKTSSE